MNKNMMILIAIIAIWVLMIRPKSDTKKKETKASETQSDAEESKEWQADFDNPDYVVSESPFNFTIDSPTYSA